MAQVQTDAITGPPLSECVEKHLATREQDLNARTLNQHRLALERLQHFLEAQNVVHIREMTVDHLKTFKTVGLPAKFRTRKDVPYPARTTARGQKIPVGWRSALGE
jgi:hypothetical protein